MKIGIVTFTGRDNYGQLLQNYALQETLTRMGHELWTIDTTWSRAIFPPLWKKCASLCKHLLTKCSHPEKNVRVWMTKKEWYIIYKHFHAFQEQHIRMTEFKKGRFEPKEYNFDAYVVGSDQIWRYISKTPSWTFNFFLNFIPSDCDVRRVAYAPSFAVDRWEYSPESTRKCAELARRFDAISVRETSGVNFCRDHLGVEAVRVLDPTMLLDAGDYLTLLSDTQTLPFRETVFRYILDDTDEKASAVRYIAAHLGKNERDYRGFTPLPFSHRKNSRLESCVFEPVENWLQSFRDARFVVTDSFHGTVFSMLFEKPFLVIVNEGRGGDRFRSLLEVFNLQDRMTKNCSWGELDKILAASIDWKGVKRKLVEERVTSMDFLRKALELKSR